MKNYQRIINGLSACFLSLVLLSTTSYAQNAAPLWDTRPDTWVAIDDLGRIVPTNEQVGAPKAKRTVGMFYFLWLGEHGSQGPFDISQILAREPNAITQPDNPLWGPIGAPHHWGEPLFGYYRSDDEWVLRKHAQMLSDAGIDVVIFDVTNQLTYPRSYRALCRVWSQMRREGGRTPQIAFLTPFWDPSRVTKTLYQDFYRDNIAPELWFRWPNDNGVMKPLIMADPALISTERLLQNSREPARLEKASSLGQSFHADKAFTFVGGSFPTWSGKNSGAMVTLYDRPGGRVLAQQVLENISDNAISGIELPAPLPAGDYYFEQSAPQNAIGWWTLSGDVYANGRAYADGLPAPGDRTLGIRYLDDTQITIFAGENSASPNAADAEKLQSELRNFFTFRKPQPSYFEGPTGPNQWGWLEVFPQHIFSDSKGAPEQMTVGVAQNALDSKLSVLSNPRSHGRSFHDGLEPAPSEIDFSGRNFQEQWNRALEVAPPFVFVTGWNEWIAGRFDQTAPFYGSRSVTFVDQFNREFSRDIEPMRGGHGDTFYLQLIDNVRRYKGARPIPLAGPAHSIKIDGDFSDWRGVEPEFRDDRFDVQAHDHASWNVATRYTDSSGRNDFEICKVARDNNYCNFYVRTLQPITNPTYNKTTGAEWMNLWINSDNDFSTGWHGFDIRINRAPKTRNQTSVEMWRNGNWATIGTTRTQISGREMELSVPRALLPKSNGELQFKWTDNTGIEGDVLNVYTHGDSAPNGRFAYRYLWRDNK